MIGCIHSVMDMLTRNDKYAQIMQKTQWKFQLLWLFPGSYALLQNENI